MKKLVISHLVISADRPLDHPKGAKHITTIINGDKIQPGVILGKGTCLTIKKMHFFDDGTTELVEWNENAPLKGGD